MEGCYNVCSQREGILCDFTVQTGSGEWIQKRVVEGDLVPTQRSSQLKCRLLQMAQLFCVCVLDFDEDDGERGTRKVIFCSLFYVGTDEKKTENRQYKMFAF